METTCLHMLYSWIILIGYPTYKNGNGLTRRGDLETNIWRLLSFIPHIKTAMAFVIIFAIMIISTTMMSVQGGMYLMLLFYSS